MDKVHLGRYMLRPGSVFYNKRPVRAWQVVESDYNPPGINGGEVLLELEPGQVFWAGVKATKNFVPTPDALLASDGSGEPQRRDLTARERETVCNALERMFAFLTDESLPMDARKKFGKRFHIETANDLRRIYNAVEVLTPSIAPRGELDYLDEEAGKHLSWQHYLNKKAAD